MKGLNNKQVFHNMAPGAADGLRCDTDGNVWAGTGWVGEGYDGVHIFAPDGTLIGKIHLPEICSNICFGGVKRNRLFMTGSQSLYSVYVEAQGRTAVLVHLSHTDKPSYAVSDRLAAFPLC